MRDEDHGARVAMLRAKMAQLTEERHSGHFWELNRRSSASSMTEAIATAHWQPTLAAHLDFFDITRFCAASILARDPRSARCGREQQGSQLTSSSDSKVVITLPDPPSVPMGIGLGDMASVEIVLLPPCSLAIRLHLRSGGAIDVPATASNIAHLEKLGLAVQGKHLLAHAKTNVSTEEPEREPGSVPGRSRKMGP